MVWASSCGASPGTVKRQLQYFMVIYKGITFRTFSPTCFVSQCLLRSPVNPDSSVRAGDQLVSVAKHAQSVPYQRHLLLLLCHGALH